MLVSTHRKNHRWGGKISRSLVWIPRTLSLNGQDDGKLFDGCVKFADICDGVELRVRETESVIWPNTWAQAKKATQ